MLDKTIRVLNFDDSVTAQKDLMSRHEARVIEMRDLGPRARLSLDGRTAEEIAGRLRDSDRNSITFLGSGDFHHISHILLSQFEEEMAVILFDMHPDWDMRPPRLGCGSWVNETLKRRNISKFISIGVSSNDISTLRIQAGNLGSLKNDRL